MSTRAITTSILWDTGRKDKKKLIYLSDAVGLLCQPVSMILFLIKETSKKFMAVFFLPLEVNLI